MRISDWSSDVCASDLRAAGHWARARERRQDVIEQAVEARAAKAKHQHGWFIHKTYNRGDAVVKIGRAPCRERVCKSVSFSVVAVCLKSNIAGSLAGHIRE